MKYSTFVLNKLSSSTFLQLYILSCGIKKDGPIYGKEVLDYIKNFNIAWQPSHGTLYPIIEKMKKDGLLEQAYVCENRKYYQVTPLGKDYYKERAIDFKNMLLDCSNFYSTIANNLSI